MVSRAGVRGGGAGRLRVHIVHERGCPMTYPIVLAHGICRFDIVARAILDDEEQSDDRTHYFRCIRSTLQANGFTAYHSAVPWAKSVSVRATALKANVEEVLRKEQCPKAHY